MNLIRLFSWLPSLFRRGEIDAEMSEEIRHHLELQEKENFARGMSRCEARYAALRSFGGVEQVKEQARSQRTWVWLEQFQQDIRYGLRMLGKNPGFAVVAVLTFALGVGATTAVFTAINALFLTSLPVREASALVQVTRTGQTGSARNGAERFSYPLYTLLQTEASTFPTLAAFKYDWRKVFALANDIEVAAVLRATGVTGNFFSALKPPMALGRGLGPEDDRVDDPQPVAVLSYAQWIRLFGGDPAVLGKTIKVDDIPFTVVGVVAPEFHGIEFGPAMDMWVPLSMAPRFGETWQRDDNANVLKFIGRIEGLKERGKIAAELDLAYQRYVAEIAARAGERWAKSPQRPFLQGRLTLISARTGMHDTFVEAFVAPLVIGVSIIVVLVMALACANVATLLLARATARQREFALRMGLGCGKGRLIRQVVTETLLLSFAGGLGGLGFARWGLDLLVYSLFTPEMVQMTGISLNPDYRVFGFGLTAAGLTGLLVGLVPSLRASRLDLVTTLKSQGETTTGAERHRLSSFLVVTQITISVCLLAVAGLFVRTVQKSRDIHLGYNIENLWRVQLQPERAVTGPLRATLAREVLRGFTAIPTMDHVTIAEDVFNWSVIRRIEVDGYTAGAEEVVSAQTSFVGPDFFATMEMPIVHGRAPNPEESLPATEPTPDSPGVIVVTESFARKYLAGADPIGRTVRLIEPPTVFTVIGVTPDVMLRGPREKTPLVMFLPMSRRIATPGNINFWLRPKADGIVSAEVQAVLRRVAPQAPMFGPLVTLEMMMTSDLLPQRAIAKVAGFFSILGLLLSAVGLYGVLAYDVSRRTREIGIRMALGAMGRDVLAMILRKGLRLASIGAMVGLVTAVAVTRLLPRLLYGISPSDPIALTTTAGILFLVSLIACWIPAHRATKVDPMVALRTE